MLIGMKLGSIKVVVVWVMGGALSLWIKWVSILICMGLESLILTAEVLLVNYCVLSMRGAVNFLLKGRLTDDGMEISE